MLQTEGKWTHLWVRDVPDVDSRGVAEKTVHITDAFVALHRHLLTGFEHVHSLRSSLLWQGLVVAGALRRRQTRRAV